MLSVEVLLMSELLAHSVPSDPSAVFPPGGTPGRTLGIADTIVVGVDASAEAHAALCWALREAQCTGRAVLAVAVLDPDRLADWPLEHDPQLASEEHRERLAARVARAMSAHERVTGRPVPPVRILLTLGDLVAQLSAAAEGAPLLVLGRPQLHTTEPVVQALSQQCPVLLVDEHGATSRIVSRGQASARKLG
jgi:nucleotide-binding universal stress UspA family protein